DVAGGAVIGVAGAVAVDLHPVDLGEGRVLLALAQRADDVDVVAGAGQRTALVPDVAVVGDRLVLDHDQDAGRLHWAPTTRRFGLRGAASSSRIHSIRARSAPGPSIWASVTSLVRLKLRVRSRLFRHQSAT